MLHTAQNSFQIIFTLNIQIFSTARTMSIRRDGFERWGILKTLDTHDQQRWHQTVAAVSRLVLVMSRRPGHQRSTRRDDTVVDCQRLTHHDGATSHPHDSTYLTHGVTYRQLSPSADKIHPAVAFTAKKLPTFKPLRLWPIIKHFHYSNGNETSYKPASLPICSKFWL